MAAMINTTSQFAELSDLLVVSYDWSMKEDRFVAISPVVEGLLGWTVQELMVPGFWGSLIHPGEKKRVKIVCDELMNSGVEHMQQYRVRVKTGGFRNIRMIVLPRITERGEREATGIMTRAGPLLLEAEDSFEKQERLQLAMASSTDAFWCFDLILEERSWISTRAYELIGVGPRTFKPTLQNLLALVHADDAASLSHEIKTTIESGGMLDHRHRLLNKATGKYHWVRQKGECVTDSSGKPKYFAGSTHDVTGEIELVQALEGALAGKQLLLREIDHRVKNNLQLIMSVLLLQGEHVESEEGRRLLQSLRSRIKALAGVNKYLSSSTNIKARVELGIYLLELVEETRRAAAATTDSFEVSIPNQIGTMKPDDSGYVGLIINELLTNAFKHARAPERSLQVGVSIKVEDSEMVIKVTDNGYNQSLLPSLNQATSFGMNLLRILCDQLQASMVYTRTAEGLCVTCHIPTSRILR